MNSAGLSQFQKRLFQRISRLLTGRTGWMLVILLWATVVSASSTYDLNTTWGNGAGTNNPQGQWSLRYGTDLLPQHYWLGSESAWLPSMERVAGSRRPIAQIDNGAVELIPSETVFERIRQRYRR